jgi:hypothetical protein
MKRTGEQMYNIKLDGREPWWARIHCASLTTHRLPAICEY